MKIRTTIIIAFALLCNLTANAWGRLGHDAIAYIAERHLTPKAKENIERYLDNHSIVYYANWADMVRWTPQYNYSTKWHASNIDAEGNYIPATKRDGVVGLKIILDNLNNHKSLPDSVVADNIKLLTHFVGDMHCPGHAFYDGYDQKGIKFTIDGKKTEAHGFWDQHCINHHEWKFTEFGQQLDRYTEDQIKEMSQGTPEEWVGESGKAIKGTYGWFENGKEYNRPETFAFQLEAEKIAHKRIVYAGYRLARLLNEIFDY